MNILKVFYSLSINIKSKISENTKKNQLASQKGDNHHVSIRHVFTAGIQLKWQTILINFLFSFDGGSLVFTLLLMMRLNALLLFAGAAAGLSAMFRHVWQLCYYWAGT